MDRRRRFSLVLDADDGVLGYFRILSSRSWITIVVALLRGIGPRISETFFSSLVSF